MNAKTDIKPQHNCIAIALAAAQAQMGRALKSATNSHFKNKYADLASVVEACMPSLNAHGIAVIQPTTDEESGRFVETILIHGESGETLKCRVPLIVQKNDMQGYGSAVTYARRYGLMSMAGIAPEDDDGNDAARAAPKEQAQPRLLTPDQFIKLRDKIEEAEVPEDKVLKRYGAPSLQQFPAIKFDAAMKSLNATIAEKAQPENADLDGDEIPQHEDA